MISGYVHKGPAVADLQPGSSGRDGKQAAGAAQGLLLQVTKGTTPEPKERRTGYEGAPAAGAPRPGVWAEA